MRWPDSGLGVYYKNCSFLIKDESITLRNMNTSYYVIDLVKVGAVGVAEATDFLEESF